jgi:hypothetical protein
MAPLVLIVVAVAGLVTGVKAFGCETVSFGRDLMTCHATEAGDFPGDATGAFFLGLSALLVIVGVSIFARR